MKLLNIILHSPSKQFLILLIGVMGYWTYYIYSHQDHLEEVTEAKQEEVMPEMRDSTSVYLPPPPNEIEIITALDWWDMILGHIGSILASLAALTAPIFTYLSERKKKFKRTKNEQEGKKQC